ncbi:MAG: class I SAM-dependent methyltransferase [Gammaproteobacteria bacterium]
MTSYTDNLAEVPCAICNSKDYKVIYESRFPEIVDEDFLTSVYSSSSEVVLYERVVKCSNCCFVYTSPRLKNELIHQLYVDGSDEEFTTQDDLRVLTSNRNIKQLMKMGKFSNRSHNKLLDIGCGSGTFLRSCRDNGFSGEGIEPSKWLSSYSSTTHGLKVHQGILAENIKNLDDNYDLVSMWDVIEHLSNPSEELKIIRTILNDEGFLILNIPDIDSSIAKLMGRKWPFYLSVHLLYFSKKTIQKLLKQCGFEIVSYARHWQSLKLGYVFSKATGILPFLKFLSPIFNISFIYNLTFTYWIGQSLILAKKSK